MITLLFLAGFLAACAAMAFRRPLVARLGAGWLVRYLVVQAVLINGALLAVVLFTVKDWSQGPGPWLATAGYAALFFFYSLSNIDWTIKKFHTEGE